MIISKKKAKNYASFYNSITASISGKPHYVWLLNAMNTFLTRLVYLTYPLLLCFIFLKQKQVLLSFIFIPAFSFTGVSLVRHLINRPRPYERWEITPLITKERKGCSLPSRHVFSAVMISMAVLWFHIWLGLLYLILSVLLAVCRVLGGVHYPKDVLAGYALGLLGGLLLFLQQ